VNRIMHGGLTEPSKGEDLPWWVCVGGGGGAVLHELQSYPVEQEVGHAACRTIQLWVSCFLTCNLGKNCVLVFLFLATQKEASKVECANLTLGPPSPGEGGGGTCMHVLYPAAWLPNTNYCSAPCRCRGAW